jgi:monoamine oxidase
VTQGEDLEAPVGRLAFAGGDLPEVASGWIEGAIASGGRAAARVAAMLEVDVPA